jgi:hypothetical protein
MANIKFSQLPNLATPTDATTIPVVDSGTNYTVTGANLKAYTNSGNLAVTSVSATGNITGLYILGNGSQLTGLPATYSNANVVTLLSAFGSNTVSTTGNVTAGYVLGNGSQLTGLGATYSNANVVTLMAAFGSNTISTTGNITASNFIGLAANATYATTAGTATTATSAASAAVATTAGTVTTNAQPNITSVGVLSSLSASGNVTGAYIKGNGTSLTGIVTSIVAGTGISVDSATGAVTITNTGGGSGGSSISNGNVSVSIPVANGNIQFSGNNLANTMVIRSNYGSIVSAANAYTVTGVYISTGMNLNGSLNMQGSGNSSYGVVYCNGMYTSYMNQGVVAYGAGIPGTTFLSSPVEFTSSIVNMSTMTGSGLVLPSASVIATRTYTGIAGSVRSVTNSPTYAGKLCYWSTTSSNWRYVADDTAV